MFTNVSEIPQSVLRPQHWTMWKAIAYTGKTGDTKLGETFVRALSEESALVLGKSALRVIGIRGRFVVNVSPYYPWCDSALQGFLGYSS
jgi:hypothetical protein